MHIQHACRLRAQLLRHGGPGLTVIIVPWYLDEVESSAQVRVAA
jgi:hypothetical protein